MSIYGSWGVDNRLVIVEIQESQSPFALPKLSRHDGDGFSSIPEELTSTKKLDHVPCCLVFLPPHQAFLIIVNFGYIDIGDRYILTD